MAKLCACGCGERLRDGTSWSYKRGHKTNPPGKSRSKKTTKTKTAEPVLDLDALDSIETLDTSDEYEAVPYTLEDAAEDTPDDAVPDDADYDEDEDSKSPQPYVRITKKIRSDIEGKVGMMLGMLAMTVALRDDVCGPAIGDSAEAIASKIVPIICKSPDMVNWFTKSGSFVLWLDLFMACLPVVKTIGAHHILKARHPMEETDALTPDFSAYRVD